jgi:hypothetical protein
MEEILLERLQKYKDNLKKAQKKYRENNKEKINEIARNYYNRNKDNEDFMKKQCEKSKKSQKKIKQLNI